MLRIFVYGSLKKGFSNHSILRMYSDTKFLGKAVTDDKFKMVGYSSGTFPYIVRESIPIPVNATQIQGELYEISEECLGILDTLEGHPEFYTRCEIYVDGIATYIYLAEAEEVINDIQNWLGTILLPIHNGIWNPKPMSELKEFVI